LKSTETARSRDVHRCAAYHFSNFGSLKSTETISAKIRRISRLTISAISAR